MNKNNDNLNISVDPTFILTSKDVIEYFTNELYQKGLNENLSVNNLENISSKVFYSLLGGRTGNNINGNNYHKKTENFQ